MSSERSTERLVQLLKSVSRKVAGRRLSDLCREAASRLQEYETKLAELEQQTFWVADKLKEMSRTLARIATLGQCTSEACQQPDSINPAIGRINEPAEDRPTQHEVSVRDVPQYSVSVTV
jgi:hypothetical protein